MLGEGKMPIAMSFTILQEIKDFYTPLTGLQVLSKQTWKEVQESP